MSDCYLVTGTRSAFARFGGSLSSVRPDDLAADLIRALVSRLPGVDWARVDDVILGNANQAGEDNRNVARMSALLAGLPDTVPGITVNRLCASGADAIAMGARQIRTGEADLIIAGGVESMSRAPYVLNKPTAAFARDPEVFDTTIGWRFVNPKMKTEYGTDSMPETAENVAAEFNVTREDQDAFALRSQQRAAAAIASGRFAQEITPIAIPQRKGDPVLVDTDEHPRGTSLEALSRLPTPFREGGSVTAGNASGVNDGAGVVLLASSAALERYGLEPMARISGAAAAGVPPGIMGIGPTPAVHKLLSRHDLQVSDLDLIELNEAFASQALAVLRQLGVADDAEHVNPHGGAIALGHPLGATGARLVLTAAHELANREARRAVATMCVGVGQGVALLIERP